MFNPITGLPGIGSSITATPREVLAGNIQQAQYLPGMHILDGNNCADPGNSNPDGTFNPDVLRAGNILGKLSSSGKYANSIIGLTPTPLATSSTSFTLSISAAQEILRRFGAAGALTLTGQNSTNSASLANVTSQTLPFANVTIGTASATVTLATNAAPVPALAGALVQPADGSQTPIAILADKWAIKVTDLNGNRVNVPADSILLSGHVKTANVVNYPTNAALVAWLKSQLNANCLLTFDDAF